MDRPHHGETNMGHDTADPGLEPHCPTVEWADQEHLEMGQPRRAQEAWNHLERNREGWFS